MRAGRRGNDREIEAVNERWFSNEWNVLVKSLNSDPRFGETTYRLTGIVQGPPGAWLFQIPADYTVTAPGGRGGRGDVPAGGARRGGGAVPPGR